jgi:SP family general alpha glucoside:H+ symporter-like MFS transporter
MALIAALRLYYKAIGWSVLLSLSIAMEGFDVTLITSFFALPSFKRRYGSPTPNGDYEIPSRWQAALTSGAWAGEVIGLLLNGFLTDRFGNRRTMIAALTFLTAAIFLAFFANSLGMLLASQILCGIPWGIFQTLSTTYAAECMPLSLRAYLTSNVNLCWLIGQVISVSILRSVTDNASQWAYRIPFSLQWIWAIPILLGVIFAPESPWWLIRHERPADARRSIVRLTSASAIRHPDSDFSVDEAVALMQHTNQVEKNLKVGMSYLACFKGSDLRRTEIVCMVWMIQTICGCMTGYATYFYVQAGLSTNQAFSMAIAMYGAGIVGLVLSWLLMKWFGRRTLYLWGITLIGAVLLAAGFVGIRQETPGISWALGTLIVVMTFTYDCTVGPVCYSLVV